jgi:hypothetical protein
MTQLWLVAAAMATLVTALTHSFLGERRLIGPLVASQQGVLTLPLAQQVLRFAWHVTSLLWVCQALLLLRAATSPEPLDRALIAGIGVLHVGVGLFDGYVTRGKHIGWPMLTAIGAFCLLALA